MRQCVWWILVSLVILGAIHATSALAVRRGGDGTARSARLGCTDASSSQDSPGEVTPDSTERADSASDAPDDLEASAEPGPISIRGTVRFQDGSPAEGCTIRLPRVNSGGTVLEPATATTGPDGRYLIENAKDACKYIEAFYAEICAEKILPASQRQGVQEVDFLLPEIWDVTVRVVDDCGLRVPGAWVRVIPSIRRQVGPDGIVCLRVERCPQEFFAEANNVEDDHGWSGGCVQVSPPAAEVTIILRRLGIIGGTLLDPNGAPIPDSQVCLDLDGELVYRCWTDSMGHFRVLAESGRTHSLRTANAPDEPKVYDADGKRHSMIGQLDGVVAGQTSLKLQTRWMSWDRELAVRVLSPDGHLLRNPSVALSSETDGGVDLGREEERGDDGLIRFSRLPETRFRLWAWTQKGDPDAADWLEPRLTHVIPAGQVVELQFRRGAWIEGYVIRPDGNPASDAGVWTRVLDADRDAFARTDLKGHFRLLVDPAQCTSFPLFCAEELDGHWMRGAVQNVAAGQSGVRILLMPDAR